EANGAYSKAINVGGIRRDFVRTLLQNLFTDTEHCEKLRRNNGIPMVVGLENEEVAYRSLGRILALCYQGTAARFESGPLFSSNFYRALAFYPCSTQIALALLDLPADVEDIVNGKDTASDEAYSRAYQVLFNCEASDQEHRAYFAEKQHQKELDEQLMLSLSDPSIQVYCQALQWIAEEMEQGLGETEWTALQARPCEEIQTCIEGSLV
ncbi:MAG: hypothetical protein KDK78_04125, partial [Chlamydiia bacterium]|nr:hypothetical protein [Chlamydiia bacterium]